MFKIIKLTTVWVVGLLIVSFLGSYAIPKIENKGLGAPRSDQSFNFFLSLAQWDGGNYLEIAKNGYARQDYYAFAPVYPKAVQIVSSLLPLDYLSSALLISLVSFTLFVIIFYKYVAKTKNQKIAQNSVLTFIFFPTAFFCLLAYSESLFLLLTISTVYLMEQKKFAKSALVASLVPLTRFIGTFFLLANFIYALKKWKSPKVLFTPGISFIPFLLYLGFLNLVSGDTFLFSSAQSLWGRFTLDPLTTIFLHFVAIFSFGHISLNSFFDLAVTLLFILILIKFAKKLTVNVWIFSMLAILIPTTTGTLTSMPRYALASLGVFMIIGEYFSSNPKLKLWVWSASLGLQAVLLALFITGHWVA